MASSRQQVLDEVEALKAELNVSCRVIERVGDFQFVISAELGGCTLKLQLSETYPLEAPCLSLRSTQSNTKEAESQLNDLANNSLGSPMLQLLTEAALSNISAEDAVASAASKQQQQQQQRQADPSQKKRQSRAARRAAAAAGADDTGCTGAVGKLKSMKTADDVIKRIHWDENLPEEFITIGYMDRFKGLVEKPFDAFSWENIASVDYFTFVIPRHRISHFRYKRAVIWDKRRRLDLVFGSVGAPPGFDLRDFIAAYREEDYLDVPTFADADSDAGSDAGGDSDFSDDSDDGIDVVVDRRIVGHAVADSDDGDDDEGGVVRAARSDAASIGRFYVADLCRPNFFVCVRIDDAEVSNAVQALQARICAAEPLYRSCCIPAQMLHCTLLTLRLDSAEQVADCSLTLQSAASDLRNTLPQDPLQLVGTGCFFGRVLHAKVQHGDDFAQFVHHLQAAVRSAGHHVLENHEFVPHVTIMKTTRPVSRQLGSRLIPAHLYSDTGDARFGSQRVTALYLCSMEKERGPDGFYVSPGCVQFQRNILTVED